MKEEKNPRLFEGREGRKLGQAKYGHLAPSGYKLHLVERTIRIK